jgi:hypothetical protein
MEFNDPDDMNPGVLYPQSRDFKDVTRIMYRNARRTDPQRQDRLQQAIRHLADSPEEARALARLVAQLEHDERMVVLESDLGGAMSANHVHGFERFNLQNISG